MGRRAPGTDGCAASRRRGSERASGAVSTEYLAVLVVAATLLAAVSPSVLGEHAVSRFRDGFCRLVPDACAASPALRTDEEALPASCPRSRRSYRGGLGASVTFLDAATGATFVREERSDGTTSFTVVDDGRVGVTAGVGAELDAGPVGAAATAEATAAVHLRAGDTWIVPTEEADAMQRRLAGGRIATGVLRTAPFGLDDAARRVSQRFLGGVPDPDVTFTAGGVSAGVDAQGRLGAAASVASPAHARAGAAVGVEVGVAVDQRDPDPEAWTSTRYLRTDRSVAAGLGLLTARVAAGADDRVVLRATRDAHGELVAVELVSTAAGDALAELGVPTGAATGSVSAARADRVVETITLPLDHAGDRLLAEQWLATGGAATAAELTDLVHRTGRVSVVGYRGHETGLSLGASAAFGARLGGRASLGISDSEAVAAYYLGASRGSAGRDLVPFAACTAPSGT